MDNKTREEYNTFIEKVSQHSVKESWVKKNLPNFYEFTNNLIGISFTEKVYLIENEKAKCKSCDGNVKFLSIKRGYREFCSYKCSNNNLALISTKILSFKKNSIDKWGVDNPSKSEVVRDKIKKSKSMIDYDKVNEKVKKTNNERYGVDNVSQIDEIKAKKKITTKHNFGVDNPFESEEIKNIIKKQNMVKYGVTHHMKLGKVIDKLKKDNINRWGVNNYTKTKMYKELMFEKYRGCDIRTNLNTSTNYMNYLGLGKHEMYCDNKENHTFITNSSLYHSRNRLNNKQCTICFPVMSTSFKELELYNFIKSIYNGQIIQSYRDGLEIDIYLPELKIGFEFNGLYWHSELFKDKNYHLDKTKHFNKRDIRIIHIWEDDWSDRRDILESQIKNWIGLTDNKIYGRKCVIKEIDDVSEYRNFLNNNHIQGYVSASLKIGLYYNDELVSLMTFDHFEGRKKMLDSEWNLSRFCNKINTSVIGGASKLISYFNKTYKPTRVISFADKSWSTGNLYTNLGFYIKNITYPNYSYIVNKNRSNKQKWTKKKLIKMGYDKNLSESKIMEDNLGSYKIFDCGQIKFEKIYR